MRTYYIIAISQKTGIQTLMTRYPMPHNQACEMLKRFTFNNCRRLQLVEA